MPLRGITESRGFYSRKQQLLDLTKQAFQILSMDGF